MLSAQIIRAARTIYNEGIITDITKLSRIFQVDKKRLWHWVSPRGAKFSSAP